MKIYLIGSLKNLIIPIIGKHLRATGHYVFDDWHAGGPTADAEWQRYHKVRGDSYAEALKGLAGENNFQFDMRNLHKCDAALLITPAGKSGHMELGLMIGMGKLGFVFFEEEPKEWDLMYKMAAAVFFSEPELLAYFRKR